MSSPNTPKIVQIRVVADDQTGADAALALLQSKLGDALQNTSKPRRGKKGGYLSYGNLLVQEVNQSE